MLSNFIEEFKNSKYYADILAKHNVILMFVSGSRIIDVTDERSDYDLVAIVDEPCQQHVDEYLIYNGVKVHWYFRTLTDFVAARGGGLQSYGAVLFSFIRDGVIIYANPYYEASWKLLIADKDTIATNGLLEVSNSYWDLIDSVLKEGAITPTLYTKILSHLCVCSFVAQGEPLTEHAKGMLKQLKRIRWQPVSDEAKNWCVERIVKLNNWLATRKLQK